MTEVTSYTTGLQRGYVKAATSGVEGGLIPLPEEIIKGKGKGSKNLFDALTKIKHFGGTHYTITECQDSRSTQYFYTKYTGYRG